MTALESEVDPVEIDNEGLSEAVYVQEQTLGFPCLGSNDKKIKHVNWEIITEVAELDGASAVVASLLYFCIASTGEVLMIGAPNE